MKCAVDVQVVPSRYTKRSRLLPKNLSPYLNSSRTQAFLDQSEDLWVKGWLFSVLFLGIYMEFGSCLIHPIHKKALVHNLPFIIGKLQVLKLISLLLLYGTCLLLEEAALWWEVLSFPSISVQIYVYLVQHIAGVVHSMRPVSYGFF